MSSSNNTNQAPRNGAKNSQRFFKKGPPRNPPPVIKVPVMTTETCFTCKRKFTCVCSREVGSDPKKYKECTISDKFPKLQFSREDGEVHLCSQECGDKWMEKVRSRRNSAF